MKKRSVVWEDLKRRKSCQVLILGGGVNGTGVFRDLALQGIDCVLVDKDDFSAGASSKSSRMIHGGLRYLENAEFKLVKEAVYERNRLLRQAAHFVSPLKTTIPIDSWLSGLLKAPLLFFGVHVKVGGRGACIVKLGLTFYDILTGKQRQTPRHFFLSKKESLKQIPGLRDRITCTANYWDAMITQSERLCLEMIEEGCLENQDCAALNYVNVSRKGDDAVVLTDLESGEETSICPKIVVNATGAWVDLANAALGAESHFMGGTKGSHLVIDNQDLYDQISDRMVYYEHEDGRICIVFRFMDKVIMGSTDLRVANPDDAECEDSEIEYMMTTLKGVFPGLVISREDIVFKFCGVRPLPSSKDQYTSRVARSHSMKVSEPDDSRRFPIYSMIGGKLTTFGAFAEQVTDKILVKLGEARKMPVGERPYLGARNYPIDDRAKEAWLKGLGELDREYASVLLERYGTLAAEMVTAKGDAMKVALKVLPGYSVGEIEYMAEHECIRHLSDLTRRRSVITLTGRSTEATLAELADIVGDLLGWDAGRRREELHGALAEAKDGK
ncbi:MAG: glycerol-3-phosphate dehydrogenase/oxidase [Kiritimatiellae bacterium]|nr:glycerol-3-phosphate dehydrogenase/oxidase [Kiritimatiellia bacterium]